MGLLSEDDLDYYLAQLGAYFAIMLRDNPDDTYKELYSHYDAVREHIQTLEKTNGWISVKDRLPEEEVYVLVWETQGFAYCDMLKSGAWNIGANNGAIISHWMPLPEPPKEET